jgi:hypothetical protein
MLPPMNYLVFLLPSKFENLVPRLPSSRKRQVLNFSLAMEIPSAGVIIVAAPCKLFLAARVSLVYASSAQVLSGFGYCPTSGICKDGHRELI